MDFLSKSNLRALLGLSNLSLDQINRYLTTLRTRNYAKGTQSEVVKVIKRLLHYLPELNQHRVRQNFTQVSSADLDAFIQATRQKGLAPTTINHSISILKNFFEFRVLAVSSRDRSLSSRLPSSATNPLLLEEYYDRSNSVRSAEA